MTGKPVGNARHQLGGDRATEEPRDSETDWSASDFAAWPDAVERFGKLPLNFARTRSTYTPDFWPAREDTPPRDETERTWHHLLPAPDSEWDAERRQQQATLKLLPRRIRRAVTRVRSTYLRGAILELATNELLRRATNHDRLFETHASSELTEVLRAPLDYVPSPDAERLVREMEHDSAFMLRIFKAAKALIRQARMLNAWSSGRLPSSLPKVRIPRSRPREFETWCGLTLTPLPHRPPEGLLVGLARRCWGRVKHRAGRPVYIMDWGAGNSPFTVALLAAKLATDSEEVVSHRRRQRRRTRDWLFIDEVDTLGDAPPELSFVRRTHAIPRDRVHDYVVMQLPPPCATRGGYRDRHKDLSTGEPGQSRLRDLGRLGVRRWSSSAPRVVHKVLAAAVGCGEVSLLVPLFTVGVPSGHEGSRSLSTVVDELRGVVRAAGLTITHDVAVESGGSGERWICIIAARGKSNKALPDVDWDDWDDIEAILEAL
jgi:hypothetical protein